MLVIAADDSTARSWRGWREKMWFQSKLKREQVTSSYLLASLSPGAVPMRPPILVIKITNFVRSHLTSSFGLVLLCTLISSFVAANPITTSPTWSHLHFLLCFCPALSFETRTRLSPHNWLTLWCPIILERPCIYPFIFIPSVRALHAIHPHNLKNKRPSNPDPIFRKQWSL